MSYRRKNHEFNTRLSLLADELKAKRQLQIVHAKRANTPFAMPYGAGVAKLFSYCMKVLRGVNE